MTMQQSVTRVKVDSSLHDYALEIVNRTRKSDQLALGVSPRGTLMLQRAARRGHFSKGATSACLTISSNSPWPSFPTA